MDKLFDGIRWVATRIYRASCVLINGFWRLVRLTGPKTGSVHPFSVAPTPVTVSRYRTPNATSRRLLLHNDRH